jgi:hypothetical protein
MADRESRKPKTGKSGSREIHEQRDKEYFEGRRKREAKEQAKTVRLRALRLAHEEELAKANIEEPTTRAGGTAKPRRRKPEKEA